jgi:hypothetical protein
MINLDNRSTVLDTTFARPNNIVHRIYDGLIPMEKHFTTEQPDESQTATTILSLTLLSSFSQASVSVLRRWFLRLL